MVTLVLTNKKTMLYYLTYIYMNINMHISLIQINKKIKIIFNMILYTVNLSINT